HGQAQLHRRKISQQSADDDHLAAKSAGLRRTDGDAESRCDRNRQPRHHRVSLHVEMSLAVLLAATVFVTNERAGTITAIDSPSNKVVKTFAVGTRVRGMALSPDGKRLYVAVSHFRDQPARRPDEIAVIDARSFAIVAHFKSGTDPEGIALSPDGKRLFISNEDAGTASIVDTASGKTVAALVVGTEPEGIAVSHDGKW